MTKKKVKKVEDRDETIDIELDESTFMKIAVDAHNRDITFNQMCDIILKEEFERLDKLSKKDRKKELEKIVGLSKEKSNDK